MAQISIYNCSFTLNQNKSMSFNESWNSSKQPKCHKHTQLVTYDKNVISCDSRIPLNYSFLFHPSFPELYSALYLHRQYWLLYCWLPLCKRKKISVYTVNFFFSLFTNSNQFNLKKILNYFTLVFVPFTLDSCFTLEEQLKY